MKKSPPAPIPFSTFVRNPVLWLPLGGGSGLSPFAPGTAGTLVAIPLYALLLWLPEVWQWILVLLACVAGIWICEAGSRRLASHDHPAVVWDEIAAFLLLLQVLPQSAGWWLAAFVAFRFFDIVKPWPIRLIDRSLPGGIGIMADDLLAVVYAWLLLQLGAFLLPIV